MPAENTQRCRVVRRTQIAESTWSVYEVLCPNKHRIAFTRKDNPPLEANSTIDVYCVRCDAKNA